MTMIKLKLPLIAEFSKLFFTSKQQPWVVAKIIYFRKQASSTESKDFQKNLMRQKKSCAKFKREKTDWLTNCG